MVQRAAEDFAGPTNTTSGPLPSVPSIVRIQGNRFLRNSAGGASAGDCSKGPGMFTAGGALQLIVDVASLDNNTMEDNTACM
jgi:hypothetical protein